jgi:hypothetical protein
MRHQKRDPAELAMLFDDTAQQSRRDQESSRLDAFDQPFQFIDREAGLLLNGRHG